MVNVEQARGEECSSPEAEKRTDSASWSAVAQESSEHCVDCTDVPLSLSSTTEPCESAVLTAQPSEALASLDITSTTRDLGKAYRHAARMHDNSPARRVKSSLASFRQQEAHLFSDTSIVRAKGSVELLI